MNSFKTLFLLGLLGLVLLPRTGLAHEVSTSFRLTHEASKHTPIRGKEEIKEGQYLKICPDSTGLSAWLRSATSNRYTTVYRDASSSTAVELRAHRTGNAACYIFGEIVTGSPLPSITGSVFTYHEDLFDPEANCPSSRCELLTEQDMAKPLIFLVTRVEGDSK